jgi:hypothetical protein
MSMTWPYVIIEQLASPMCYHLLHVTEWNRCFSPRTRRCIAKCIGWYRGVNLWRRQFSVDRSAGRVYSGYTCSFGGRRPWCLGSSFMWNNRTSLCKWGVSAILPWSRSLFSFHSLCTILSFRQLPFTVALASIRYKVSLGHLHHSSWL